MDKSNRVSGQDVREPGTIPPSAHLLHQTRRRMRLKVPSRRHDTAFFKRLEQQLAAIPKIEAAIMTPATASVLLSFAEGEGDSVAAALDALESISLAKPEHNGTGLSDDRTNDDTEPPSQQAAAGGTVDRRALAFTVLVLLLLRQLLRGGWLAPALALLWFLFEVLRAQRPEGEARS